MIASHSFVDGLLTVEGQLNDFAADPVTCMTQLRDRYGDLVALRESGQQLIFAFGPDYNRELLSQPALFHARFFALRGSKKSAQRHLTSGLLSMNGPEHIQQRRIVKGAFTKPAVSGYRNVVTQLTDEMLADWQLGQVRDISADMTHLMLRITSSILFGLDQPELAFELGEMLHKWVELNHELGMSAFRTEDGFYPKYQSMLSHSEAVEARVRELFAQRRQGSAGEFDMLSLLMQANSDGEGISDDQLIGQAALLFAAAHMTTAHSLMWTLFLLSQHPEVAQQLDAELVEPVDFSDDSSLTSTTSVLNRVIRESMRLLPASSYSQRIAQEQVTLGSATLPSGSIIVFSQFMTHRIESIYAEPKRFNPDRWLTIKPSSYEYLPFGGGPRLCLGASLATSIIRTVLPQILRRFSLCTQSNAEINALVISTMLGPTTTVPMQLRPVGTPRETVPLRGNITELVTFPAALPQAIRRAA